MLTSVYHPIDEHRVVEQNEAERLLSTGVWFDCPRKAKEYRENVEKEILAEPKVEKPKAKKAEPKEQENERQ